MRERLSMSVLEEEVTASSGGVGKGRTDKRNPQLSHYLVLGIVPIVWGTYSPVVKYIFDSSAASPPPLLFNLASYLVSFGVFQAIQSRSVAQSVEALPDPVADPQDVQQEARDRALLLRAGVELGLWLFLGSIFLVNGIAGTTATRAAILVQLTTVIVPVLDALGRRRLPSPWSLLSCALATLGVVLVTSDVPLAQVWGAVQSLAGLSTSAPASAVGLHLNAADMICVMAAGFYSMHVVRLGAWAGKIQSATGLARVKSITQLSTALLLLGGMVLFNGAERAHLLAYGGSLMKPLAVRDLALFAAGTLWNGAFCTGFTMWAQTYAQSVIPATTANIVYSSQPVWAGLFSLLLLGEHVSGTALLGGGIIAAAIGLALGTLDKV